MLHRGIEFQWFWREFIHTQDDMLYVLFCLAVICEVKYFFLLELFEYPFDKDIDPGQAFQLLIQMTHIDE